MWFVLFSYILSSFMAVTMVPDGRQAFWPLSLRRPTLRQTWPADGNQPELFPKLVTGVPANGSFWMGIWMQSGLTHWLAFWTVEVIHHFRMVKLCLCMVSVMFTDNVSSCQPVTLYWYMLKNGKTLSVNSPAVIVIEIKGKFHSTFQYRNYIWMIKLFSFLCLEYGHGNIDQFLLKVFGEGGLLPDVILVIVMNLEWHGWLYNVRLSMKYM